MAALAMCHVREAGGTQHPVATQRQSELVARGLGDRGGGRGGSLRQWFVVNVCVFVLKSAFMLQHRVIAAQLRSENSCAPLKTRPSWRPKKSTACSQTTANCTW